MNIQQIKTFSNGIKAYLGTAKNGKTSLLSIADKDGCLIAQRKIKNDINNYGGKVLEKTTVRAGKDGKSSMERLRFNLADNSNSWDSYREYSNNGRKIYQNNNSGVYEDGVHYFTKDATGISDTGWISTCENTIDKMFRQWFNFRKGTMKETPRPINPNTYA